VSRSLDRNTRSTEGLQAKLLFSAFLRLGYRNGDAPHWPGRIGILRNVHGRGMAAGFRIRSRLPHCHGQPWLLPPRKRPANQRLRHHAAPSTRHCIRRRARPGAPVGNAGCVPAFYGPAIIAAITRRACSQTCCRRTPRRTANGASGNSPRGR